MCQTFFLLPMHVRLIKRRESVSNMRLGGMQCYNLSTKTTFKTGLGLIDAIFYYIVVTSFQSPFVERYNR